MRIVVSRSFYPLQKQYPLVKSVIINCTPQNCHRVCESVSSRMVVSWYVWHQTKKSSCLGPLLCRVACCRVVSCRELSLTDKEHQHLNSIIFNLFFLLFNFQVQLIKVWYDKHPYKFSKSNLNLETSYIISKIAGYNMLNAGLLSCHSL